MRLSDEILQQLIEINCPDCEYPFEVQLVDARTQVFRRCPCCRLLIHLIDDGGSLYGELQQIDSAMDDLTRTLKGLF
jgi:hypothetical protein